MRSGATWITVYWSRPVNAPYLDRVVEYVITISAKSASSGKSCNLSASVTRSVHDTLSQLIRRTVAGNTNYKP